MRKKGALDFATARAGGLGDDQQAGVGIGGKSAAAPDCASRQFGLGVGGFMKINLAGWLAYGSFVPLSPGVEKAALHGQNAVKSGQKQRRTLGGSAFSSGISSCGRRLGLIRLSGAAGFVKGRQASH